MKKPVTPLPEYIDFGGFKIPVLSLPAYHGSYGEYEDALISIKPDCPIDLALDTAIHECLHHFFNHHQILLSDAVREKDEEGIVLPLTDWLLILFRLNPFLLKWFLQAAIENDTITADEILALLEKVR